MPEPTQSPSGKLRPIHCFHCGANNFVGADLPPMTTMPCNKCGREIMIPYLLRNFEIRQAIASGGMGTVYRAFDTILKREVAVKLMKKELGRDQKMLDEFYKEARMIAALNHPNIIQIFNFGEMEGENFIAMELANRGSVESRCAEGGGKLPELQMLDVGIKIAGALDVALKQNLIHRDIKPANILFNADNEPKLVDFGLAREADKDVDYGEEVWGTPEYSAPEKFKREPETFRSDMYSLGCALYQAISGQLPFPGPSVQEMVRGHCEVPVTPPHEIVPEVSAATSEAIVRSLAKKARERFDTYEEFIMALTSARSQLLIAQTDPAAGKAATRKGITGILKKSEPAKTAGTLPGRSATKAPAAAPAGGSKKLMLVGGLVALGAIAGAGVFMMSRGKPDDGADAASALTNTAGPAKIVASESGDWLTLSVAALQSRWGTVDGKVIDPAWSGMGGVISYSGSQTGAIATLQDFDAFDLSFEWKPAQGQQGAVFCALPRTGGDAMDNALRFMLRPNAPKSGRLAPGALTGVMAASSNVTVKPIQQFNTGRLVALTNHVELWINGVKAVGFDVNSDRLSNAVKNNSAPVGPGFGKTTAGALGFEVPAGFTFREVKVRNITGWPKDLAVPAIELNTLERPKVTGPFVNLSGDKAEEQWRTLRSQAPPKPEIWKFDTAFLTCTKPKEGYTPAISTRERYNDFELLLEWRADKGGKGQIIFGIQDLPTEAVQNAYRIAIGDAAAMAKKDDQAVGSLIGIVPSANLVLRPIGQFNTMRIVSFGERAEVWMNGAKCTQFDLNDASFKTRIPKTEYKDRPLFGKTLEGWIGLNPSDGITIRAMRVRAIAQPPQGFAAATGTKAAPAKTTTTQKKKKK